MCLDLSFKMNHHHLHWRSSHLYSLLFDNVGDLISKMDDAEMKREKKKAGGLWNHKIIREILG